MAPTQQAMSSGSVVFSLPHIRDAIFGYHAEELLKERNAQLQAIARPVTAAFWESFAKADGRVMPAEYFASELPSCKSSVPQASQSGTDSCHYSYRYFLEKREALSQHTDVFHVMDKLGLKLASYIEFLASRPHDVRFWVSACSALGGSRKWEGSGFRDYRLEAAPRDTPDNGVHEEPDSIPAQMLMTASINYRNGMHGHYGDKWAETEGLAHLLRDKAGRIFVMRLLDIDLQPFLFDMAAKHPERLLSDDSPFFPIYEVLSYNSQVGIAIWQPPPHPLGYSLFPDSGRDELRRVLERAHDLFANLATLERWGVSLNAGYISSHWERWITTWGKGNGCIVPAYLRKVVSEKDPGKLAPAYLYEERLPSPPATAWPIAPLSGNGGIAGLPWSQITAYNDPRVGGPRFVSTNERAACHGLKF